jgi:hypothetical protein
MEVKCSAIENYTFLLQMDENLLDLFSGSSIQCKTPNRRNPEEHTTQRGIEASDPHCVDGATTGFFR